MTIWMLQYEREIVATFDYSNGSHYEEFLDGDIGYFETLLSAQQCLEDKNAQLLKQYDDAQKKRRREHELKIKKELKVRELAVRYPEVARALLIPHAGTFKEITFEDWCRGHYGTIYTIVTVEKNIGVL